MEKSLESYNLINYLKVVDTSVLSLLDYVDLNDTKLMLVDDDKLILKFNANCKRLLEGFVVNTINDSTYYGKHNILLNSCKPEKNWRNQNRKLKSVMLKIKDESVYIDELKFNSFVADLYGRLPNISATLNKKNTWQNSVSKIPIYIQKDVEFLQFEDIDLLDSYAALDKILSSFGIVNKDDLNYNIIEDRNCDFSHDGIVCELFERVRLELIKKGII